LENHVPHINALAEFNQDTSESARDVAIACRGNSMPGMFKVGRAIAIVWKRRRVNLGTMGLWRNGHNLWILQSENVD
jgi:hypothetical protein